MTNKITLSRELVENLHEALGPAASAFKAVKALRKQLRALLDADPVPPAGGEPEVVAWRSSDSFGAVYGLEPDRPTDEYHGLITLESHRAHVTQLRAEVERLNSENKERKEFYEQFAATQSGVISRCNKRRSAAESELTKARELLESVVDGTGTSPAENRRYGKIREFLSNQSAPADKGQGEPLIHITPEVLAMLRGERKMMAGGLTYSQSEPVGNWTVPLYAEQPAPVAVDDCDKVLMGRHEAWKAGEANGVASLVMPERKSIRAETAQAAWSFKRGWNACLDEVARLNPIKQ